MNHQPCIYNWDKDQRDSEIDYQLWSRREFERPPLKVRRRGRHCKVEKECRGKEEPLLPFWLNGLGILYLCIVLYCFPCWQTQHRCIYIHSLIWEYGSAPNLILPMNATINYFKAPCVCFNHCLSFGFYLFV
jgi:hypothetical protein